MFFHFLHGVVKSLCFPTLEQNKLRAASYLCNLTCVQGTKSPENSGDLEHHKPRALSTPVTVSLFNDMI